MTSTSVWQDVGILKNRSLKQKASISAQLVDMLGSRLEALHAVADNRIHGLECDLNVKSGHCTKKVEPLHHQSLHDSARGRARARQMATSNMSSASLALQDRLLGLAENRPKSHPQMHKKARKQEARKNARADLERQLQGSMEGNVTRSVDNVSYRMSDASPPLAIRPDLLLAYAAERMRLVSGKRTFMKIALAELSCHQCETIFWFLFCNFFQKNSDNEKRKLVTKISTQYVQMVSALQSNSDVFYRTYPYAVASAICWGFYYVFPGSRHLYTTMFKNKVFLIVCELLLGIKLCPVSVQAARKRYFPEEMNEDMDLLTEPETLNPVRYRSSLVGAYEFPDGSSSVQEQSVVESNRPVDRILDSVTNFNPELGSREKRLRQKRYRFNAAQLSPLVQEYLSTPYESIRRPYYINRTTPTNNCIVGGLNTFQKNLQRSKSLDSREMEKSRVKCRLQISKSKTQLRGELQTIKEARDQVLSCGNKGVNTFCLDLVKQKGFAI